MDDVAVAAVLAELAAAGCPLALAVAVRAWLRAWPGPPPDSAIVRDGLTLHWFRDAPPVTLGVTFGRPGGPRRSDGSQQGRGARRALRGRWRGLVRRSC